LIRAVWLREIDLPACFESDERSDYGARVEGRIYIDGQDIYAEIGRSDPASTESGMIFQKSNPFPKSIYENVAYGVKINSYARRSRSQ
jgi:phosphate transport system ATP-binding protein